MMIVDDDSQWVCSGSRLVPVMHTLNQPRYHSNPQLKLIETAVMKNGERPVVLFHGGPGDKVALQFVEKEGILVGKLLNAPQCCLQTSYLHIFSV